MDWEFIAPMVVLITLFLSIAGVLIFRPLSKRLADLLQSMHRDKQARLSESDVVNLTEHVDRLADRVEQLEERQDFSERLLLSMGSREATEPAALRKPSHD